MCPLLEKAYNPFGRACNITWNDQVLQGASHSISNRYRWNEALLSKLLCLHLSITILTTIALLLQAPTLRQFHNVAGPSCRGEYGSIHCQLMSYQHFQMSKLLGCFHGCLYMLLQAISRSCTRL